MTPRRGPMNLKPEAANRTQRSLERHGETNWYEWTLREFLRYLFGLGVLALIVFVPLQIQLSWLPSNAPPAYDPSLVAILTVIAFVLIGVGVPPTARPLGGFRTTHGRGSSSPSRLRSCESSRRRCPRSRRMSPPRPSR